MRVAYTVAALIFCASSLVSQTAPATVILTGVPSLNCPVAVSAQRWAPGGMALAQDAHSEPQGNKLYLRFAPGEKSNVIAATVTLHGTDNTPRAELATAGNKTSDLTETFQLRGSNNAPLRDSGVSLSHLVNVRWIDISEIHFVDGSTWRESKQASCHITPNGFRLVAGNN